MSKHLSNKAYRDKTVAEYFKEPSQDITVEGIIPSTHFRKVNSNQQDEFVGRTQTLATGQYKKINNDIQHAGRCYEFDDAQYIISSSPTTEFTDLINDNNWSVSFSIRKTTGTTALEDIMSNANGGAENCYITLTNGFLRISIYHESSTISNTISSIDIADDEWHDIIMSYDESTNLSNIYIDGAESTYSTQVAGTGGVNHAAGGAGVWAIGRFSAAGNVSRNFNGKLRAIRFFDRLVFGENVNDYTIDSLVTLTGEDGAVNLYDLNEGATWVANLNSVLVEDSQVDYSWLNEKGYNAYGYFDGSSHVNCGNDSSLKITGDISFGAWIKTTAINVAILSKYGFSGAGNVRAWQLRLTSGVMQVYISDDGTLNSGHYKQYQGAGSATGSWVFLAATFDASTSTLKLYQNGTEVTPTKSNDDSIASIVDTNQDVYIGAISNGSPVTFFDGEMKGAFIYNRILSDAEILSANTSLKLPHDSVLNTGFTVLGDSFKDNSGLSLVNNGVDVLYKPSQPTSPANDVNGYGLEFKGKLASRLQLVNASALILNGVDQKIQVPYEPTNVLANGVDVTADWTFTDIGSGNWTLEPDSAATIYNLVVNSTYIYPCPEGDGTTINDVSGNNNHGTVVNAIFPDIWGTQDVYHYNFMKGFNNYYNWNGSRFVRLNTGWELANDWKVILRDIYVSNSISSTITLFSLNGAYYTYLNVTSDGELNVGIVTSAGFTNIPIVGANFSDGESHKLEVVKSSTGDGSGNGVKVIFDDVDLGWITTIADTTLATTAQTSRTTIGHYGSDLSQNLIGNLGDVEFYDISDTLIKKFTASNGYRDQSDTAPLSADLPTLIQVPAKSTTKDALNKDLINQGYETTHNYNGASNIQFPSIPGFPSKFKGRQFSLESLQKGIIHNVKNESGLISNITVSTEDVNQRERYFSPRKLLLDDYDNLIRVYSSRKLLSNYNGNAVQAEDWNDNSTYEVGFKEDKLDIESLILSTLGNNVGVKRWYDQSGSGEYLSENSTIGRQFRIKDDSNNYQSVNGYPVFEGTPLGQPSRVYTEDFALPAITLPYTVVWTINNISTGGANSRFVWDRPTASFNNVYGRIQNDDEIGFYAGTERTIGTVINDKYIMMMVVTNTTDDYIRAVNSTTDVSSTISVGGTIMNSLNLGSSRNLTSTNAFDGNILEFMIFAGDLRNDEALISNLKQLLNI